MKPTSTLLSFMDNLGISAKETELYIKLLELGQSNVLDLSKATSIPRTTVHQNVDHLIKAHLVKQLIVGKKRVLVAEPPNTLKDLLEGKEAIVQKQQKELQQLNSLLPDIEESLSGITPLSLPARKTQVEYYEGYEVVRNIYKEILRSPLIHTYFKPDEINVAFPENLEAFFVAARTGTVIYDIGIYEATNTSLYIEESKKIPTYHHKILPRTTKLQCMDYLMFDNSIAIIQANNNPNAVLIRDAFLYENAVSIFKVLWDLLPEEQPE